MVLASLLTGCPTSDDCFPAVGESIRIADNIEIPTLPRSLLVVDVARIRSGDVTGTDAWGIPQGPAADEAVGDAIPLEEGVRAYVWSSIGVPYPTWYYAFVDLNGSGRLESGEPFGVDRNNPVDSGCRDYHGSIVIDLVRP